MFFKEKLSPESHVPENITKDWLTELLVEQNYLKTGAVSSVVLTGRNVHHHSNIMFLQVSYSSDASPSLPAQWVLKVRTEFEGVAEGQFYHLARISKRSSFLPHFGAFKVWPSGASVLLLENLKPTHKLLVTDNQVFNQGQWLPTRAVLTQVLRTLACFHAQWWNARELPMLDKAQRDYQGIIDNIVPLFSAKFKSDSDLTSQVHRACEGRLLFEKRNRTQPLTCTHGDCFPWHFFSSRNEPDIKLFDFEFSGFNTPAYDLVALLCYWQGNYSAAIQQYHDVLIASNVHDYTIERLNSDIRLAVLAHSLIAVEDWHRGCSQALWKTKLQGLQRMFRVIKEN